MNVYLESYKNKLKKQPTWMCLNCNKLISFFLYTAQIHTNEMTIISFFLYCMTAEYQNVFICIFLGSTFGGYVSPAPAWHLSIFRPLLESSLSGDVNRRQVLTVWPVPVILERAARRIKRSALIRVYSSLIRQIIIGTVYELLDWSC